jgi:hypothetical protein
LTLTWRVHDIDALVKSSLTPVRCIAEVFEGDVISIDLSRSGINSLKPFDIAASYLSEISELVCQSPPHPQPPPPTQNLSDNVFPVDEVIHLRAVRVNNLRISQSLVT